MGVAPRQPIPWDKNDPVMSCKAMRTLEDGLQGHHKETKVIQMRKIDSELARNDEEKVEVFSIHLYNIFNNQHIPCNPSIIDLIQHIEPKNIVGDVPTIGEIVGAVKRM